MAKTKIEDFPKLANGLPDMKAGERARREELKKQKQEVTPEIEARAREMRREYKRNWAKKNREKMRQAEDRYWLNKAMEEAAGTETPPETAESTNGARYTKRNA